MREVQTLNKTVGNSRFLTILVWSGLAISSLQTRHAIYSNARNVVIFCLGMRPWSASGAFSAAEYEDAKRRVRRLEPPQALPALDIENKSSRARKTASQTAVSSGPPPCSDVSAEEIGSNQKKPKPVAAEGTFLGSLQSNIRELSLLIENRLSANAQVRATVGADFSELQLHVDRNLVA